MRNILRTLGCALVVAMVGATGAQASVQDFDITSFDAVYFLAREDDGVASLGVNETIVAEFPDFDQNHGLLRAIPKTFDGHSLELSINNVSDELGRSYPYESYTENDNLILKIGDPDAYVHGTKTYKISYFMRGVIKDFANHQEFYWDVNGDQWRQATGSVKATVYLVGDIKDRAQPATVCYAGFFGSIGGDCTAETVSADRMEFATTRSLQPHQTLSLVIGFEPGTFAAYTPSRNLIMQWILTGIGIAAPPVVALTIAWRRWWRLGRDPKGRGIIVPEYLPPKEVTVLESSSVLHEGFQPKALTATIIDLAVRHYLKIYEITEKKLLKDTKTYEIELVKDPGDLHRHEKEMVDMLFSQGASVGARVAIKTLKNKLYTEAQKLGKKVDGAASSDGYFVVEPSRARAPFIVISTILFILGLLAMPWTIGLLLASGVFFIFAFVMPSRTLKGVGLRDHLLGLKDYMKLAEAERLQVLQSPRGTLTEKVDVGDKKQLVKLYERLLPYAVLFGIEKEWAAQFASLYDEPPQWYAGSTAFNAAYLASAVHSFDTAATSSFTPPASSSSSGFSGGGAGGGGGGGGGGGW